MTKKFLFFFILGFLLSTSNTFACGTNSNSCCCKTEKNYTPKKKCSKKTTQTNNENKNCNGKCGHSGCSINSVQLVLIVTPIIEIPFNSFFESSKKIKFHNFKTNISSGFNSIWLPPVIG